MSGRLKGKTALITGGSSGTGLATAKRFVEEGAFVFITGRRQTELDAAAQEIGAKVQAIRGDAADLADLDSLFAIIKQRAGKLDILFANAGTGEFASLGRITEEHFDKQFDLNVKGLLFTVQGRTTAFAGWRINRVKRIHCVANREPGISGVYSATKAAVRSFARTWSVDLKDRKIRVNAISPGVVPTPGYNTSLGMSPEQVGQFIGNSIVNIPLGRARHDGRDRESGSVPRVGRQQLYNGN
jgi:NAD(P)-dependent dehydrogenase (short-subunit alcohol dehydrogenase family)